MQSIVYTTHEPDNHQLVADRVREEKPDVYFSETPESLEPLFRTFLDDPAMSVDELEKRVLQTCWRTDIVERGSDKILLELRRLGARFVAVESDDSLRDYSEYQGKNVAKLVYQLSLSVGSYCRAKGSLRAAPSDSADDIDNLLTDIFPIADPGAEVKRFEDRMEQLLANFAVFVEKEIARDICMAKRIKAGLQPNSFGYFGYAHRVISHLLAGEGVVIPHQVLGIIASNPEEKLSLLLKYEQLGLDPEELRSDDPAMDCDPSKKDAYLALIPHWFVFKDTNKRFSARQLAQSFWKSIHNLIGSS